MTHESNEIIGSIVICFEQNGGHKEGFRRSSIYYIQSVENFL